MPSLRSYLEAGRSHALDTAESFDPRAPLAKRVEAFRTYCLALKMVAYGRLLCESNVPAFFSNLYRVARNGKRLLETVRDESEGQLRIPASANDWLLSAIVTDFGLAREIAALSARELTPPEYDDEFYAASFLQVYLCSPAVSGVPAPELEDICRKMDEYLEGETSRTRVYRAMLHRDWSEFTTAFASLNEEVASELDEAAALPGATYSMGITQHFWLEGLALLKLAESEGLRLGPARRRKVPLLVLDGRPDVASIEPLLLGLSAVQRGAL
ncbi:hypothetical protein ACN28E_44210 [Archangium lansingense]|uniref:hypothetical protein n=1 Tax=Archangium lansingense TaxID=2995310 RepID=UPI003B8280FF